MSHSVLDSVAVDLLSIPPLLRRGINRKVFKEVFAAVVKEGVTLPHFEIMETLVVNGSLPIAEIGHRLQIPRPQMTHLIDRLAGMGLVARQPDSSDRRITNVDLTARGRALYDGNEGKIRNGVKERLSSLSAEELKELSGSLRTLRDILAKLQ